MEMTMTKTFPALVALTLALAAPLAGARDEGRPIDERRPLKANAHVEVSNTAGLIEVETWDKNELHLTGTLSEEVEKLEITGSDARLKIEVKIPDNTRNIQHTNLHLKVPAGISLDASGVSADVRIRGLKGNVEAASVSGDIEVEVTSKEVEAQSVSGDVTVQASAEMTRVESVSGDVTVRGVKGEVRGESVSGDVRVEVISVRRVNLESVSGDLELEIERVIEEGVEIELETLSGDVRMSLPALPDVDIDLETFSGGIARSGLLPDLRDSKEYSRSGKRKGDVRLHSFSGDIEVQKK
jgi:DUF4097 and DUF4098 domain-containing protein YvlB